MKGVSYTKFSWFLTCLSDGRVGLFLSGLHLQTAYQICTLEVEVSCHPSRKMLNLHQRKELTTATEMTLCSQVLFLFFLSTIYFCFWSPLNRSTSLDKNLRKISNCASAVLYLYTVDWSALTPHPSNPPTHTQKRTHPAPDQINFELHLSVWEENPCWTVVSLLVSHFKDSFSHGAVVENPASYYWKSL